MKTVSALVAAVVAFSGLVAAQQGCSFDDREPYCCDSKIERLSDSVTIGVDCTYGECDDIFDKKGLCGDVGIPNGKKWTVLSFADSIDTKNHDL